LEGLLAVVGLEVKVSGLVQIRGDRGRVPDFMGCDAEAASAK